MRYIIILFWTVLILCSKNLNAQSDFNSWVSTTLVYKVDKSSTFFLKPIWRQNNDLQDYQNTSIDFFYKFNINKSWHAQYLFRYFFIPEGTDRTFFFYDIAYKQKLSTAFQMNLRLRYHQAVDYNKLIDPDFIRLEPKLLYKNKSKFTPFLAADIFYRVNKINTIQRVRYQIGTGISLSPKCSLSIQYWYEPTYNIDPNPTINYAVLDLKYVLN